MSQPLAQAPIQLQQQLAHFDGLCSTLYEGAVAGRGATSQLEKQKADEELKKLTEDLASLGSLKFFLENSQSKYAQFVAASGLKNIFTRHWNKIELAEKLAIKDYLVAFLAKKAEQPQSDTQVVKMVITLLCKVVKMSWFDHPQIKSVLKDLVDMQQRSERHFLLSLMALHDLIIEMSYIHKVKNLTLNRRISLNFRDCELFQIFKASLEHVEMFVNQIQTRQDLQAMALTQGATQPPQTAPEAHNIYVECLLLALSIQDKCLGFDFSAILMNETLDEPTHTNLPSSWAPFVNRPGTLQSLFRVLQLDLRSHLST